VYVSVAERLNITLDDEYAEKLARLAERADVQPGTLAGALLSTALDEVDPDARVVADLLDSVPGVFDRAKLGRAQADGHDTVPLDEL
jgi:hypothetical protein